MADVFVLGLYKGVDSAAQGIQGLLKANFAARDIDVLTGVPYPDEVWGLPEQHSNLRKFAAIFWVWGAIVGFTIAAGTAWLYQLPTAAKPIVSLTTIGVIVYEFAMLHAMFATAIGTLAETGLPDFSKKPYHPKVTEGWPAVIARCRDGRNIEEASLALQAAGAEEVIRNA